MGKVKDLVGKSYGDLTVVERGKDYVPPSYPKGKKQVQWLCACSCGNTVLVSANNLRSRRQQSCGCKGSRYQTTHGMSNTITYHSWEAYVQRCTNPNNIHYSRYKDRVYVPWVKSFEAFLFDLGERPSELHTLDRIDNTKGYSPDNCRWVTQNVQSHNHIREGCSSKYKGVSYNKRSGKWECYITKPCTETQDKKVERLGLYEDEIDAASVYNQKALEYYGEFACLNDIKSKINTKN